jgi:ABC-2 type transport system permease protein
MSKIGLIIGREYITRVRKKSFIVMTILGPLLIAGFLSLTVYLGMQDDTEFSVLIVDPDQIIEKDELKNSDHHNVSFDYTDTWDDKAIFMKTDYNVRILIDGQKLLNNHINPTEEIVLPMQFKDRLNVFAESYIKTQIENIFENLKIGSNPKFTRKDYDAIKTNVSFDTFNVNKGVKENSLKEQAAVGFFFAVLIYLFIFMYGSQVMRGVIEEKTNRIVEVIISSVRPFQLMMGKIIGVAMVGLSQFIIWVVLTMMLFFVIQITFLPDVSDLAMEQFNQENIQTAKGFVIENQGPSLNEVLSNNAVLDLLFNKINFPFLIASFIFYFLGGYLLYSALFAAIGSAVDSESDTQQFMLPITIPLIFGFVIAEMSIVNPVSQASFWASMVPLTSPVVMMVQVAVGVTPAQFIISALLLIGGFLFTVWIASRIYRIGILSYGKKPSWKELFRWIFMKN